MSDPFSSGLWKKFGLRKSNLACTPRQCSSTLLYQDIGTQRKDLSSWWPPALSASAKAQESCRRAGAVRAL
jgi:hypothetical protein